MIHNHPAGMVPSSFSVGRAPRVVGSHDGMLAVGRWCRPTNQENCPFKRRGKDSQDGGGLAVCSVLPTTVAVIPHREVDGEMEAIAVDFLPAVLPRGGGGRLSPKANGSHKEKQCAFACIFMAAGIASGPPSSGCLGRRRRSGGWRSPTDRLSSHFQARFPSSSYVLPFRTAPSISLANPSSITVVDMLSRG